VPIVTILPDQVSIEVKPGTSLLASASAAGVDLMHSCGGIGACTSCRVRLLAGSKHLSDMGATEAEQLAESGILETHRLACQAAVFGDVAVKRPLRRSSPDSPVTGD
jgi:ferredoxin, 2Fe-2S